VNGQRTQTLTDAKKQIGRISVGSPIVFVIERSIPAQQQPTTVRPDWQWEDENGNWISYLPAEQLDIEEAYQAKQERVIVSPCQSSHAYDINTRNLTQKNVRYGTTRNIRRSVIHNNAMDAPLHMLHPSRSDRSFHIAQYPSHWKEFDDVAPFSIVALSTRSSEYAKVSQQFAVSCRSDEYTINSISRVQNMNLYNEYQLYRATLVKELGEESINEMKLFHGTAQEAVEGICKDGFDWRVCGKNGTVYGHGSYFAKKSKYSAAYARSDSSGERKMFLASVLAGRYTLGSGDLQKAPEGFHSVVNGDVPPSIFVVFLIKQAYPEYVISFRKLV